MIFINSGPGSVEQHVRLVDKRIAVLAGDQWLPSISGGHMQFASAEQFVVP